MSKTKGTHAPTLVPPKVFLSQLMVISSFQVAWAPKTVVTSDTSSFSQSYIHLINRSYWLCPKYIQNLESHHLHWFSPGLSCHGPLNWLSCFLPCLPTDCFHHSSQSDAVNCKSDFVTSLLPISFRVLVLVYKMWYDFTRLPLSYLLLFIAYSILWYLNGSIPVYLTSSTSPQTFLSVKAFQAILWKTSPLRSTTCCQHYLPAFPVIFFSMALTINWHQLPPYLVQSEIFIYLLPDT